MPEGVYMRNNWMRLYCRGRGTSDKRAHMVAVS